MLKPILTLGLVLTTATAFAGTPTPTITKEATKEESIFDKLWQLPVLYSNKENPWIQEFRLTGRFHGDVYSEDSAAGYDQDWIVRRLRAGAKMKFLNSFEAVTTLDFTTQNADPAYLRFTDLYLAWKPSDLFNLTVGKHSAKFTLDGSNTSNELRTIDRNNLSGNIWFTEQYFSGVTVSGKANNWQWRGGYYSGSTNKELGDFEGGYFGLLSVGYDFGKAIGAKKALLRADYVYNDPDAQSNGTKHYQQVGSLNFQLDEGRWGTNADVVFGIGSLGQSDSWGFMVEPWFNLTEKLQLVGRYTHISSSNPNGLTLNKRYEGVLVSGRGDEYNELYAGLNYYIYGHRLKVQTGWQYAQMQDSAQDGGEYNGWAWTTAFRFSF